MSGHARRVLTLALAGLVIAIITGRAEFAGVAAPAVLLLATWRRERPQQLQVTVALTASKTVEGERSVVDVTIEGQGEHTVQARLHPARAILPLPGPGGQAPGRGAGSTVRLPFAVTRWGRHHVGTLEIILRDRWRLAEGSIVMALPRLDCYPRPAAQQTRVVLSRLPNRLGEHPARAPGEGIEFAGVREYVPGDRQRSINWPATTRRGRLQVNTFAAERSQDVVILVDATPDAGEPGHGAADLALREPPRRLAPTWPPGTGWGSSRTGTRCAGWSRASASGSSTGSPRRCWPIRATGRPTRGSAGSPGPPCRPGR